MCVAIERRLSAYPSVDGIGLTLGWQDIESRQAGENCKELGVQILKSFFTREFVSLGNTVFARNIMFLRKIDLCGTLESISLKNQMRPQCPRR